MSDWSAVAGTSAPQGWDDTDEAVVRRALEARERDLDREVNGFYNFYNSPEKQAEMRSELETVRRLLGSIDLAV